MHRYTMHIQINGGINMDKKILNVKYSQSAICGMGTDHFENVTQDIKNIIEENFGDKYVIIFTPFDFQELTDDMCIVSIKNILQDLHNAGKQEVIDAISAALAGLVSCDNVGQSDCNEFTEYHSSDETH